MKMHTLLASFSLSALLCTSLLSMDVVLPPSTTPSRLTVQACDGTQFPISEAIAQHSKTWKYFYKSYNTQDVILPLPSECTKDTYRHLNSLLIALQSPDCKSFIIRSLQARPTQDLIALTCTVNYLDIPRLFEIIVPILEERLSDSRLIDQHLSCDEVENLSSITDLRKIMVASIGKNNSEASNWLIKKATEKQVPTTLLGHTYWVSAVEWIDNTILKTTSYDGTIKIWDTNNGKCLETFARDASTTYPPWQNSYFYVKSPDNNYSATAHNNAVPYERIFSIGLISSNSGSYTYDDTIKILDRNHECLHALSGHNNRIAAIAWSPDGCKIATASLDRTAKIWQTNLQLLNTLQNNLSVQHALLLIKLHENEINGTTIGSNPRLTTLLATLPNILKPLIPPRSITQRYLQSLSNWWQRKHTIDKVCIGVLGPATIASLVYKIYSLVR